MKLEVGTQIAELNYGKIISIKEITRVTGKRAFIRISDTYEIPFKIETYESGVLIEIGADRWGRTSYSIATEKDKADLKLALAVQKLKNTEWAKLPEETIFKIAGILDAGTNKTK